MTKTIDDLARRVVHEHWEIGGEARTILNAHVRDLNILLGVLGDTSSGPAICHVDGCWTLFCTDEFGEADILCQHEDWHQFLRLVSEYTDYVSEEDSDDENG